MNLLYYKWREKLKQEVREEELTNKMLEEWSEDERKC